MSVRSGVFPKYIIEFVDANFKVSNDVSAGDFLIDADVKVTMARDTEGTKFTITLYNLPQDKATELENALKPKTYQKLSIKLGYFETKVQLVVNGVYQKVESKVAADSSSGQNRLVTTITGTENALVACSDAKFTRSLSAAEASTYATAAFGVVKEINSDENKTAHPGIADLVNTFVPIVKAALPSGTSDTKFNNNTVLTVLSEIANTKQATAELLVADGMVFLGSPIQYDRPDVGPAQLDPSANLATFGKVKLKIKPKTPAKPKTPSGKPDPNAEKEISAVGFNFTALGDPTMRPGQEIVVSGIQTIVVNGKKDFDSSLEYRIRNVEHQFSATTGYVCVGAAAEAQTNGAAGRDIDSQLKATAAGAATDVASAIKSEAAKNPVVEVTSVKAAGADNKKHPYRVDLFYGQQRADEQQPSIEVAINAQPDHIYTDRPIGSPFAWRKCGLVTPVYPTMKALVAHNLGLATDGIVTGYNWSTLPDLPPPTNELGDWWLCLPIDFDAKLLLPPDQTKNADGTAFDWKKFDWSNFDKTKAVNDLTASNGCRVIELKGLKITVGADRLKEIGTRPTPGDAEECTIAHASGAVVTIKKAEIDVDTGSGPKLTLSSSGITLTDGKLNVQLANGKLAIG